jgi:flagella synthesis protein FlgN
MGNWHELATAIATEAAAIDAFIVILRREQKLLSEGKVDDLSELIEAKTAAARDLAAHSTRRNATLAGRRLAPDRAGIAAWLADNADDRGVEQGWNKLLELAGEARELSRINGELLHIRLQHNSRALEVLLGASRPLQLYGRDGQASLFGGGSLRESV